MVFIESRPFTKRLEDLAGGSAQKVLRQIQDDLLKNPERGNLVQGLGGVRKARGANPARGKGKRGGYRYFFLYLEHKEHIHLLLLPDKGEQEDLSSEERKVLRKIVEAIRRENRRKMAKRKVFEGLKLALSDSLRYERGERVDLRATEIPALAKKISPSEIKRIRLALNASQARFAKLINVSPNTVESWEQGVRQPRHAALKLLTIARKYPQVLLEA